MPPTATRTTASRCRASASTCIDADTASVVFAPTNRREHGAVIISDGATGGTLKSTGTYEVVLTKAPTGPVTIDLLTDGLSLFVIGSGQAQTTSKTLSLTFGTGNWFTPQLVTVEADPNTLTDYGVIGIHYSRISVSVDQTATNENAYIGTTAGDIAAGLANAVATDPTGRFTTSATTGGQLTINGPAFTLRLIAACRRPHDRPRQLGARVHRHRHSDGRQREPRRHVDTDDRRHPVRVPRAEQRRRPSGEGRPGPQDTRGRERHVQRDRIRRLGPRLAPRQRRPGRGPWHRGLRLDDVRPGRDRHRDPGYGRHLAVGDGRSRRQARCCRGGADRRHLDADAEPRRRLERHRGRLQLGRRARQLALRRSAGHRDHRSDRSAGARAPERAARRT